MSEQLRLSVIIPCYNEEDIIATTYNRLMEVVKANGYDTNYEVIFIDDGSKDSTLTFLETKAAENTNIKVLSFSRNFGHQPAVCAGICEATGDVAIIIDADLQDPPIFLSLFLHYLVYF